jgi:O-antigen/teichoic acid export membrane protein
MSGISIGKGLASTSASAWTRQGSTLVLYIVAARLLSPGEIGIFALSAAVVLLFEYGVYDSISESIVQRVDLTSQHMSAALALTVGLSACIALCGFLASCGIAALFSFPELGWLAPEMAAAVAIICLSSAHFGLLRREGRFHAIAFITATAAIVSTATGIVLLMTGAGIRAMVAYFLVEKTILCIGSIWAARTYPIRRFSRSDVSDLVPYASAIGAQRMVFYARTQMDRIVIGMFWGAAALGAYQIAARIFDSLNAVILLPISKLFFVSYTKLQQESEERLGGLFIHSLQAVALVAFPAFLGISAVAPEAITLLFGEQWGPSAIILEILGFGGLALTLSVISGALLSAVGRATDFLLVETVSTAAGIALLVLVSPFGLSCMAAAFVLRETLAVAAYAFILRRSMRLPPLQYLTCFLPCLIAALAMWLVVSAIDLQSLLLPAAAVLLAKILSGALTYAVVMLVLGRTLLGETIRLLASGPHLQRSGT